MRRGVARMRGRRSRVAELGVLREHALRRSGRARVTSGVDDGGRRIRQGEDLKFAQRAEWALGLAAHPRRDARRTEDVAAVQLCNARLRHEDAKADGAVRRGRAVRLILAAVVSRLARCALGERHDVQRANKRLGVIGRRTWRRLGRAPLPQAPASARRAQQRDADRALEEQRTDAHANEHERKDLRLDWGNARPVLCVCDHLALAIRARQPGRRRRRRRAGRLADCDVLRALTREACGRARIRRVTLEWRADGVARARGEVLGEIRSAIARLRHGAAHATHSPRRASPLHHKNISFQNARKNDVNARPLPRRPSLDAARCSVR